MISPLILRKAVEFDPFWGFDLAFAGCLSNMRSIIEELKERLQAYPQIRFLILGHQRLFVPAISGGFQVELVVDYTVRKEKYIVKFQGCCAKEFPDQEPAIYCFLQGLSNRYRIKEVRRGSVVYQHILERRIGDHRNIETIDRLPFYPFWRRKHEQYLYNQFWDADAASEQLAARDASSGPR